MPRKAARLVVSTLSWGVSSTAKRLPMVSQWAMRAACTSWSVTPGMAMIFTSDSSVKAARPVRWPGMASFPLYRLVRLVAGMGRGPSVPPDSRMVRRSPVPPRLARGPLWLPDVDELPEPVSSDVDELPDSVVFVLDCSTSSTVTS